MKLVFCRCSVRYSGNIAHEVILIHISPQQPAALQRVLLVYLYTINKWSLLGCVWLIIFQDKNACMQKLCSRSLLPWFLDHVNSTYLKIVYFKLAFRYFHGRNAKVSDFKSLFHLLRLLWLVNQTCAKNGHLN